jgi:hypothetical protein
MGEHVDFSAKYAKMSEGELMVLARDYDGLTVVAQTAIRGEFKRRGLEPPLIDETEIVPEWSDLVTVKSFRDLTEATVAQSVLESAGIVAYLFDENVVRLNWGYSNAVGGVRLQVRVEDESGAKEVLDQPVPASIPFSNTENYQQPRCPACDSIDISLDGASRGVALVGLYAVGIPLPTGSETWSCGNCGARWEHTDD